MNCHSIDSPVKGGFHAFRRLAASTLIAAYALLCLSSPAWAQAAQRVGDGARQVERIQQEQQERQRQQLLDDARRRKETAPLAPPEVVTPVVPASGACRDIKEIVLAGVTLLSESEQHELIEPFLDRCLLASDIEALLGDIVKAYIDRGYISVRPYLRAQDLSGGRLEIVIVEGKVESILLEDGGKKSVNLTTAFPGVIGQALNLRDIEQGMDQINRLASNGATMEILPGTEAGDSVVRIANDPTFPIGISPSVDNLGSETTGVNELGVTLNVNNPLRLNDFFSYTRRESFAPDRSERRSIMDSAYYSVPFGYALFSLSYSGSSYRTPVALASGTTLRSTGDSDTVAAKMDWVSYRDQVQKLTESIAITQKTNKNYLEGYLLEVSSRTLSILDLDVQWNRFIAAGSVNFGLGYSKGLDLMGALSDAPDIPATAPHAQGGKFRATAGLFAPFKAGSYDASFSSQLSAQYAQQGLYSSEQMLLGSYYTVRGFVKNSLSGDRAFYVRNELALALPDVLIPDVTLRPYVGLDGGRVSDYGDTAAGTLIGCALGVRVSSRRISGEISLVKPLRAPQSMVKEASQVLATFTLNF